MTQKIIKTGNSSAVTIPAKFMKVLNLKAGDEVIAVIDFERGEILYKFFGVRQLALSKFGEEENSSKERAPRSKRS